MSLHESNYHMCSKAKTPERSIRIIEAIRNRDGANLEELDDTLEISRSTIHRHLQTLIEHGYITREGEHYHIDLKFLNLGEYARSRKCGYRLVEDTIYELHDEVNEECEFIVENAGRGILVYESYHPESQYEGNSVATYKDSATVGTYFRLHNHAAGKAILAALSDERIEEIIEQWGLPPRTDRTITTRDELRDELDAIREQKIAYSDEEFARGLREVARCVTDPLGNCVGALAVIGPTYRMTDSKFTREIPDLLEDHVTTLETKIEAEYLDDLR